MLRTAGDISSVQAKLQAANLAYVGEALCGLSDLLKRGKVIIRLLQTDGSITLLHIHSSGNLAFLIMDDGQSTTAVSPEELAQMLTNVFALVPDMQVEIYLYTEPEVQAQDDMETTEVENSWQMVSGAPASGDSSGASAPPVLVETVIGYVNAVMNPTPVPGAYPPTAAMTDLITYGGNNDVVDGIMSSHDYISSGNPLDDIDNLAANAVPFLIFVTKSKSVIDYQRLASR